MSRPCPHCALRAELISEGWSEEDADGIAGLAQLAVDIAIKSAKTVVHHACDEYQDRLMVATLRYLASEALHQLRVEQQAIAVRASGGLN